jgi:PIN domain nuclease of toxin-antitoxin system
MRLLIDTHALIWYVDQDHLLSTTAHATITDPANDLLLGVGTLWELGIKFGLGKLKLSQPFRPWVERAITDLDLGLVPITLDHADTQAG